MQAAIAHITPLAALIRREFLVQLRSRRTFWIVLLGVVICAWGAWANWPRPWVVWIEMAMYGRTILTIASMTVFLGSALFIPGIAATAIVTERERGSWELMSTTLIRPYQIVFGKLVSAAGLTLLGIVAAFPVFASVFFLIGVDWSQLTGTFLLTMLTSVTMALIGIACSATFKRSLTSILASYAGMLVVMGAHLLPLVFLDAMLQGTAMQWIIESVLNAVPREILTGTSTFFVMVTTMEGLAGAEQILANAIFQCIIAAFAVLRTILALRKPLAPHEVRNTRLVDVPAGRVRLLNLPRHALNWFRGPRLIPDRANPVFHKERRWLSLRSGPWGILLKMGVFLLFLMIATIMAVATIGAVEPIVVFPLFINGFVLSLLVPVLFANAFAKEFEQRNIDALRMTLLTPWQIVAGKARVFAGLIASFFVLAIIANLLPLAHSREIAGDRVLTYWITGYTSIAMALCLAIAATMWTSMYMRTTVSAIVASVFAVLFAYFGIPVLAMLTMATIGDGVGENDPGFEIVASASPVTAYANIIGRSWSTPPDLSYWAASMAVAAFASLYLFVAALSYFRTRCMRER